MLSTKKQIKRLQGSSYVISLEPSDVLGEGSFGKVVRAFDMDHKGEQLVAKIIEINSQSKIESLRIEMKVLEAFQSEHHNLVAFKRLKLYSKKCYYIIMEYCSGGNLEEKIEKTKQFAEIEIFDFLSQFASGYRELYRQDIIHRDIKPANIMLHNRVYKIADFGLAKIVETIFDRMNLSVKGTPLYMAPEMIKEEAICDPKIDMWSLGIVLFRMMYGGQFPFLTPHKQYANRQQAFNEILHNPLQIPSFPVHSKELIDILKRMLEKDPIKRISWQELFDHPLISMKEANFQTNLEEAKDQLVNSQLFIQQMVVQKESQIKDQVKPFANKLKSQAKDFTGILGGINKVITHVDLSYEKDQEKIMIQDIIKDQKKDIIQQKIVRDIENVLLFNREQVYFLDKVALKVSCLERIIHKPKIAFCSTINQIALFLIQKALKINKDVMDMVYVTNLYPDDQVMYFISTDNWLILEKMIQRDKRGLEDFERELYKKITVLSGISVKLMIGQDHTYKTFNDACHGYFEMFKDLDTQEASQLKQLYVVSTYLTNVVIFQDFVLQFGGVMEEFWRYYETVEQVSGNELEQQAIENLFTRIDQLGL